MGGGERLGGCVWGNNDLETEMMWVGVMSGGGREIVGERCKKSGMVK